MTTLCTAHLKSGQPCLAHGKFDGPGGAKLCGRHIRAFDGGDCAVCLDPIATKVSCKILGKCGHAFHKRCIRQWLNRGVLSCPVCRAPCVSEMQTMRCSMSRKLQILLRTLPPPPGSYFPAYLIGLLTSPLVQKALQMDDDDVQRMIDVAYMYETEPMFYRALRQL